MVFALKWAAASEQSVRLVNATRIGNCKEVYYQPGVWHKYEDGLWLRATHMQLLETCYIETDTQYRPLAAEDFCADNTGNGLVIVSESVCVLCEQERV